MTGPSKGVALVTGVGRAIGIGAATANTLRSDGWTVATVGWRGYDERMPWGADDEPLAEFEADFSDPDAPGRLMADVAAEHGPVRALVMCHCESVDSNVMNTSVESFDRHMAVNARAPMLLIRAFAEQRARATDIERTGSGRVIAITSDAIVENIAYGASKAALDRIVLASAEELRHLDFTANVINPGATDTGWMNVEVEAFVRDRNVSDRVGVAQDCANLVRFLCSDEGAWINRQLLYSDGGLRSL